MFESEIYHILEECGALLKEGHFVYASGRHGRDYVSKEIAISYPHKSDLICRKIAAVLTHEHPDIQTVVGPEVGGAILAEKVARLLNATLGDIRYAWADKDGGGFAFRDIFDPLIRGKNIIVVEDVLTTGGSAKATVEAANALGANILAVVALCNRGSVTHEDLVVPELYSLTEVSLDSWSQIECPLCKDGIPINTEVGHGKAFLEGRK